MTVKTIEILAPLLEGKHNVPRGEGRTSPDWDTKPYDGEVVAGYPFSPRGRI